MNNETITFADLNLDDKSVSVIRGLILDGTRKANSGHPGGAMSSTDFAYILFKDFLKYSPDNAKWFNRDRFILSAGHESMLHYSLLTLIGYLSVDDLKEFRQFGSLTPGHPENILTPGIEATSGPLGQGISMGVGMAISEIILKNMLGNELINHYTYILVGDGDLQEPVSLGSSAIAGHLGLGKLIVFYDKNDIQISGSTSRADSTDVAGVFKSLGWQVINIDGHNHGEIRNAILSAQSESSKPTIIIGETTMAKGLATKEGEAGTHGSPLPPEEISATKEKFGLSTDEFFQLPDDVIEHFRTRFSELQKSEEEWNELLSTKLNSDNKFKELWELVINNKLPSNLKLPEFSSEEKIATRAAFGKVLEALAEQLPNIVGGSADLEPSNSTKAFAQKVGDFNKENYSGRNFAFGVREFPMGAILNGMALHGGLRPFGATFFVFSDYERPALRLSAMQKLPVLHVFTHDSFYVGEDGPTHQPIEHLASLRAIPELLVVRPADATETVAAIKVVLEQEDRPTALILTRQTLPVIDRNILPNADNLKYGAYIIKGGEEESPDIIIIASGSEVHLALETAGQLSNYKVRVISMPSTELFDEQSDEYKNKILPPEVTSRLIIEAGSTFGWHKYAGTKGIVYGIDHYGNSAPAAVLQEAYGFTVENMIKIIKEKILG